MHLFAGAGGGILADLLLGHVPVCAVEIEPYCRKVLLQRQRDGILPRFPIWDDVRTFDGRPWRGIVDCVSGGFPCQDISAAGKGAGITGERSGLWGEMVRVIGDVRPRHVFVENSPRLTIRGLGTVLGELSQLGFDAEWEVVSAAQAGADHPRQRIWIRAYLPSVGQHSLGKVFQNRLPDIYPEGVSPWWDIPNDLRIYLRGFLPPAKRGVQRNDDGLAEGLDRLKAIGNGQVPQCAALAWRILGGE